MFSFTRANEIEILPAALDLGSVLARSQAEGQLAAPVPHRVPLFGRRPAGPLLCPRRASEGRQALRRWLAEPGAGPVLEYEALLKAAFAARGTKADALQPTPTPGPSAGSGRRSARPEAGKDRSRDDRAGVSKARIVAGLPVPNGVICARPPGRFWESHRRARR
jgi:hypothetical protein